MPFLLVCSQSGEDRQGAHCMPLAIACIDSCYPGLGQKESGREFTFISYADSVFPPCKLTSELREA